MTYNDKQVNILETAEKLFSEKGYDGTSVRDIAEAAGINIAMISYYFGSKEKLMQAIFESRTTQLTEKIEGLLANETLTPLEKLNVVVDDYVERIVSKERFYKLMICEQMMEKNVVINNMLFSLKKKNADLVAKLLLDGQKKKVFKKNIDVVMLMNTMIGTVLQTFINKDYYKNFYNLTEMSEEEYKKILFKKLTSHIKELFKSLLSYEA